jgi:sterol desaturase/sphingolipid hydroxylase (fatty acid hydroxylase superfamily)
MADNATFYLAALPAIIFAVMAIAELSAPRRPLVLGRMQRWTTHALLFAANRLTVWLLARLVAVPLIALWASQHGYGLLNAVALPIWVEILIVFILLDFAMWVQHMATHKIPLLWRMHMVHHADRDLDASTAIRFHPFEIIVSTLWKALCVVILGVPALIFLAFEAWLGANALFNHSNVELPRWLDRVLRPFLVTPDMHLVHHSTSITEQNCNYGFALTIWDRVFGTYKAESAHGRDQQPVGLADMQDARPAGFIWSAKLPLT